MTVVEHLTELRLVLLKIFVAIAIGSVVVFLFGEDMLNFITRVSEPSFITNRWLCRLAVLLSSPDLCINSNPISFTNIELAGQFTLHIRLAVFGGVVVSAPYCLSVIAGFISPALKDGERKVSVKFLIASAVLFLVGITFGYLVIAPIAVHFLAYYTISAAVLNQITIQSFISTVIQTILAMGLGFELPLVVYFLNKWHIVEVDFLKRKRPVAFVVILTLAAIITPPDVFSMVIVALPLWLLYELGIIATNHIKNRD